MRESWSHELRESGILALSMGFMVKRGGLIVPVIRVGPIYTFIGLPTLGF